MPRLCPSLVSLLSFAALHANALPPQPAGAEFQVNAYTTNRQEWPAVAAAPDGDFVVVWRSHGSVGDDAHFTSLQGQRYSADGTPQGAQFQVNTFTPGDISHPSVAAAGNGDFIVVWGGASLGTDLTGSIQARLYASDGTPQGPQFQVNTYWIDYQGYPSVAAAANGDFVVVWHSNGSSETDTDGFSIQGQRFASDGSPQGSQFQINTFTPGHQWRSRVAADADGDFVVAWSSVQGYYPQVRARRFASDGSGQGPDFEVAPFISYNPSVAADADGNFIVVWDDGPQLQAQRFDSNGSAQGPTFQVNTYPYNGRPAVAAAADGDFVVVWSGGNWSTDTSGSSIQGQRFAADGSAEGGQFQVNTYTTGDQSYPAVAAAADSDDFVVAWRSAGSSGTDTDQTSIQGQRYMPEPSFAQSLGAMLAMVVVLARRRRN